MTFKTVKNIVLGGAVTIAAVSSIAYAAGNGKSDYKMVHKHWHFNGVTGRYDKAAAQRGYQVYREVCAACHQLKHVAFRHLGDKGAPFYNPKYKNPNDNPLIKNFAADWQIADIDSDTGDAIERIGIPADKFPAIFPNEAAGRASNGGAYPPDLSVMVKARNGGADYVYNLLIAYGSPKPKDVELAAGQHYNPVMDGFKIAMAPPLTEGLVEYGPTTEEHHGEVKTIPAPEATVEQMAADVTEFLAWAADPKMEVRKDTGMKVMLYLLILSVLLWFTYQRVWKDVEH